MIPLYLVKEKDVDKMSKEWSTKNPSHHEAQGVSPSPSQGDGIVAACFNA
ncbi:hypothetical protein BPA01_32980 [Brevibacillus parabrevis]|uniref:Uncharacterized protein n=1 Tax=Brevibacillus parabrevis TaxID=54914 RepID=A0A4Y3PQQ2_BREPA|nr:hypothetical protein BPA01_32980 [Brevibacillus parabrevis]